MTLSIEQLRELSEKLRGTYGFCPFCTARVKVAGFGDHMLTQHRDKWPAA